MLEKIRDSFTQASKPKKGVAPKLTKATVIYSEKFQHYQLAILKLFQGSIVEDRINPDWRKDFKIENEEDKTKALKYGSFVEKDFKAVGKEALNEKLLFEEAKVLSLYKEIIDK